MAGIQSQLKKISNFLQGKNLIIVLLLVICVASLGYVFWEDKTLKAGGASSSGGKNLLSKEEAGQAALSFINDVILKGGSKASLIDVVEGSNVYTFKINVDGQEVSSYITKDGKLIFPQGINIDEEREKAKAQVQSASTTIGDFQIAQASVCAENSKPIIYFFGSKSCPHCQWEHPIVEKTIKAFGNLVVFHDNVDSDKDNDIFSRYNPEGGIPTLVLGCKYFRVGSGEHLGEAEEARVLTALICNLTGGQPGNACAGVKDLTDKINE
jgi:thiol-disulfide isomerase/thioredoxin